MSTDCLCEYHGRASRDILRVWSGWASTVIHGPRYEPDLGPRYAPGRGPRDELDLGPRYAPGRWPRYALGCGQRYMPWAAQLSGQPQCHSAAGPSVQWSDCADTY